MLPTWAAQGYLQIATQWYEIERRISGTVFTLRENSNPGSDVASGTSYTMFRSRYVLPTDYRQGYSPVLKSLSGALQYVEPNDWHYYTRQWTTGGVPSRWTVFTEPNDQGRLSLYVFPYSSAASEATLLYQRQARPLKLDGTGTAETVGTIAWTAGSTTVTGTSTTFSNGLHAGAIIRAGTSANAPDGTEGPYPYGEQLVIQSVASATSLTVVNAPTTTVSGVKYNISDPVDITQTMMDALVRGCEQQLGFGMQENRQAAMQQQLYEDALRRALGADNFQLPDTGYLPPGVPVGDRFFVYLW